MGYRISFSNNNAGADHVLGKVYASLIWVETREAHICYGQFTKLSELTLIGILKKIITIYLARHLEVLSKKIKNMLRMASKRSMKSIHRLKTILDIPNATSLIPDYIPSSISSNIAGRRPPVLVVYWHVSRD
jgi:hypothetical protein